jgi:DNA-binding response OmpR family regulator
VTKPFDVEHLTALIGEVLERRLGEVLPEDAMIDAFGTQEAEQA